MSDLPERIDDVLDDFLEHRDEDRFLRELLSTGAGVDETGDVYRLAVDRILRKEPARAGGALMFLLFGFSDQTRPVSCISQ